VRIGVLGSAPVIPHGKAGRLKLVAVSTKTRSPSMPDVPSIAESGFAGFDMTQWFGALAPIGTPKEVVERLSAEFLKALADPTVRQRLANSGLEPVGGSPAEFAQRIREESVAWARAAKEFGIRLE
jgi:tripartite-type tricarboxylate transporter receptor subunit TctC